MKILRIIETDVRYAKCMIGARYFQDACINGAFDDSENPQMPFIENVDGQKMWCPLIDLDNGLIVGWPKGVTAKTHYKSCDDNYIELLNADNEKIFEYCGYVPDFLDPYKDGYGDYVILVIDENGKISDFNPTFKDMEPIRYE